MNVQSPSSVCSNIGKSTTNRNDHEPGSMSSSRRAISLRAAPSSSWGEPRVPAAKNTQAPRRPPRREEHAVARLRAGGLDEPLALGVGDVLGDRPAEGAVLAHGDVG